MSRPLELPVVLIPDEDGGYVVECAVIPGCISQGDTREEALANIKDAIELCLDQPAGCLPVLTASWASKARL